MTTASSWPPQVHASRSMPPGAGLFLQQRPRSDLPPSLQGSILFFGGPVPLPSPSAARCLWSISNKLLQMVTRKASLASSLTWRVAVIHSPSESNSLMYHFQFHTSHIQPSSSFEVSQHLPPTLLHHLITLLLPLYVPRLSMEGPGLGLPWDLQKLASFHWSGDGGPPLSTALTSGLRAGDLPPVLLGMATLPLTAQWISIRSFAWTGLCVSKY